MRGKVVIFVALLLTLAALLGSCGGKQEKTETVALTGEAAAALAPAHEKESSKDFATTARQLSNAFRAANLLVLGEFDYQKMQRMVGKSARPAMGYNFFRPDLGIPIFENDPRASLEVPLKLNVLEMPDGKVVVRYRKPSEIFAPYSGLEDLGKRLDGIVEQLVAEATK